MNLVGRKSITKLARSLPPDDDVRIRHLVEAGRPSRWLRFDVNPDVLWSTVTQDLPAMLAALGDVAD